MNKKIYDFSSLKAAKEKRITEEFQKYWDSIIEDCLPNIQEYLEEAKDAEELLEKLQSVAFYLTGEFYSNPKFSKDLIVYDIKAANLFKNVNYIYQEFVKAIQTIQEEGKKEEENTDAKPETI